MVMYLKAEEYKASGCDEVINEFLNNSVDIMMHIFFKVFQFDT